MEKVTILGKTIQGDFTNPIFARKYEDTMSEIAKEAEKAEQAERGSDGILIQCNAVRNVFDALFGKGTATKVMGKDANLMVCLDALIELSDVYDSQITPLIEDKKKKIRVLMGRKNETA